MLVPFSIQRSELTLPQARCHHVAVTWNDAIIIWGGESPDNLDTRSNIYIYESGEWSCKKTSGSVPWRSNYHQLVQVLYNKMLLIDNTDRCMGNTIIYSLDLKTWIWSAISPRGQVPALLNYPYMGTWIHNGKMYCCGGDLYLSKPYQLFCYNPSSNSWEWPSTGKDNWPPFACTNSIISGDDVFIFGGSSVKDNELHILNMLTMRWEKVHGKILNGSVPTKNWTYTLTRISESAALLFGQNRLTDSSDCWLLNLQNAKKLKKPSLIWSKIPNHFTRFGHAAVMDPVSMSLWVTGGHDNRRPRSDILKLSFNNSSLRNLAMDHAARNISSTDPRLQPGQFPDELKKEIMEHRDNIENVYICSADKGCAVCREEA